MPAWCTNPYLFFSSMTNRSDGKTSMRKKKKKKCKAVKGEGEGMRCRRRDQGVIGQMRRLLQLTRSVAGPKQEKTLFSPSTGNGEVFFRGWMWAQQSKKRKKTPTSIIACVPVCLCVYSYHICTHIHIHTLLL